MSECCITLYFLLSYMDTEQFEEAVRDYEKVYQTEKTKGMRTKGQQMMHRGCGLLGPNVKCGLLEVAFRTVLGAHLFGH